jgi:glycosyltransferase involved in cell wall biosynthesis
MEKIKIIQLIPALGLGGAERVVVDLCKNLDKEKFAVKVACLKSPGESAGDLIAAGIPVELVGGHGWPIALSFFKLIKFLKKEKPDIVHTHLFGADFYGRLAARLAGVKIIVSTEHNLNFAEGFLKKIAKSLSGRLADEVVAVSQAVKQYLIKKEGMPEKKISVIYNGVAEKKFSYPGRDYAATGVLTIGSVGRLVRQKGFDFLIKALSRVPGDWQCLIAGGGRERKKLAELIKLLSLENKVKLIGWEKNTPEFLKKLDIFVLPSRWEGLGIVILEAGASGLPVIASRVDGIKELISDGQDGLLFAGGDDAELAEKIKFLLANPEERKRLGENLRQKVVANFNADKMAAEYERLYLELLKK